MKKVALYDPYLDTLGGGEKHLLSILKALEDEGFEINIFWNKNLQNQIENRFRLQYINKLKFLPDFFTPTSHFEEAKRPRNLAKGRLTSPKRFYAPFGRWISHFVRNDNVLKILKNFDIFFYVTDGSYFFSSAKKNFVFCMVPNINLYQRSLFNKLKTANFRFISNSYYTQSWLKKWGIESEVIYPYLNHDFIDIDLKDLIKENIILSVGRFYNQLHSKKQSILIDLFNKLKQVNHKFKNFRLIIAGGLKQEDKAYFYKLKSTIESNSGVILKTNVTYTELLNLYRKSLIYVHMTGFGVDENKNPEQVEHLGIAPLEAMASGCLTFCYNAGGLKEIVSDGSTGFLFNSQEELMAKLSSILSNTTLQTQIKRRAKQFVLDNFSYKVFKKRVKEIIL